MPDTAIVLDFGPGRYRFWLPMQRIVECERACGDKSIVLMFEEMSAGIGIEQESDAARFFGAGPVRIKDVYEVIRCAAVGGGERYDGEESHRVTAIEAKQLVDEYVDGRPLAETVPVAWAILNAAVMGVSLKKKAAAPENESDMKPSEKASS